MTVALIKGFASLTQTRWLLLALRIITASLLVVAGQTISGKIPSPRAAILLVDACWDVTEMQFVKWLA